MQPPLIVRLACGSRGRRAVIVFACYVSFLLLPPLFYRCGSIRSFRDLIPLSSHIFSTQRRVRLRSLIPFFPLHYNHYTTFIRSAKPSSEPRKRNYTPRKNSASTPEAATVLVPLRYTPHSLSAALAQLASASPYTSAAGKALRYRYAAFPPPSLLKAVFPALFSAVSASNYNPR